MVNESRVRKRIIRNYEALENLREQQPAVLSAFDIRQGVVDSLNMNGILREVNKRDNGQKVWELTIEAESILDNYDGGGMLPCTCKRDGFVTVEAGEVVRCKECGETFPTDVVG